MKTTKPQPLSMSGNGELEYYYFGFYRVLKRYRVTSLLGWAIVFLGCLSIPFSWNIGRTTGVVEVILTTLTVFAGLAVVWQNISALEEYLRVPFPRAGETEFAQDVSALMSEVESGGWQEAYEAIGKMKLLQEKHNLPPLERQ